MEPIKQQQACPADVLNVSSLKHEITTIMNQPIVRKFQCGFENQNVPHIEKIKRNKPIKPQNNIISKY